MFLIRYIVLNYKTCKYKPEGKVQVNHFDIQVADILIITS